METGAAIKFNKKKSFRKKGNLSFNADEEDGEEETGARPTIPVKKEKKPKKSGTLLSFNDEENDDETGAVLKKKIKSKIKLPPGLADQTAQSSLVNTQQASSGEYSAERLDELRKASFQFKGASTLASAAGEDGVAGEGMIMTGDEAAKLMKGKEGPSSVPDANAIRMAKERRERNRTSGKDFISLRSNAESDGADNTRYGESRLVREDEDDLAHEAFEDDEVDRITFGDPGKDNSKKCIKRNMKMNSDDNMSEEDDEEVIRWELEQMRKGGTVREVKSKTKEKNVAAAAAARESMKLRGSVPSAAQMADIVDIQNRLHNALGNMKDKKAIADQKLERVRDSIQSGEVSKQEYMKKMETMREQYAFFQELRLYVKDVVSLVDAKEDEVEGMEKHLYNSRMDRLRSLLRRRRKDARDEICLASKAFGVEHNLPPDTSDEEDNEGPQVDEFGRDLGLSKETNKKKRAASRAERRARHQARRNQGKWANPVGWSSDEEDADAVSIFNDEKNRVAKGKEQLFSDVVDEYKTVGEIKKRFAAYRKKYFNMYRDAYVSMSLPKLLEMYVKYQLLDWDPLDKNGSMFDGFEWYQSLFDYGVDDGVCADPAKDPDAELIPRLVENVVLPLVVDSIYGSWDVESIGQTDRLIQVVKETEVYLNTDNSDVLRDVGDGLVDRLNEAIDIAQLPLNISWGQNTKDDAERSSALSFVQRMFFVNVKILRNIVSVSPWVPQSHIVGVIERIVEERLVPFLQQCVPNAEERTQLASRAASALPEASISGESRLVHGALSPLLRLAGS